MAREPVNRPGMVSGQLTLRFPLTPTHPTTAADTHNIGATLTTLATMVVEEDTDNGRGSGSALNPIILTSAGLSALLATALASMSIVLQLKNYRKPVLQR